MDNKNIDNNTLLEILYNKLNMKRHMNNQGSDNEIKEALKVIENRLGNEEITKF